MSFRFVPNSVTLDDLELVVCRCRYLTSVSVFSIFVGIFYVGSVFGIGILKYRDIGIRYFAIIHNFWSNKATAGPPATGNFRYKNANPPAKEKFPKIFVR